MRTEQVELTVLCLIHKEDSYLLQDRVKKDWNGYTFPGGHIEPGESIVDAVIREMKEETGLDFKPCDDMSGLNRPCFSSAGMTDECVSTVYGIATGEIDLSKLEANEDLTVQIVDVDEAVRILAEEKLGIRTYYLLLLFIAGSKNR